MELWAGDSISFLQSVLGWRFWESLNKKCPIVILTGTCLLSVKGKSSVCIISQYSQQGVKQREHTMAFGGGTNIKLICRSFCKLNLKFRFIMSSHTVQGFVFKLHHHQVPRGSFCLLLFSTSCSSCRRPLCSRQNSESSADLLDFLHLHPTVPSQGKTA